MSENKTFTIALNIDELNLVLGALGELPAKNTINTILNIRKQADDQTEQLRQFNEQGDLVQE